MKDENESLAERLEQGLQDLKNRKKAASVSAAKFAQELEKFDEVQKKLDALPYHERREVLAASGLKHRSAAPRPITPLRGLSSYTPPSRPPELLAMAAPTEQLAPAQNIATPAPVAALGDEKQSIERIRYEVLASRTQLIEAFSYYGVELKIFKALKDRLGLLAARRVKGKGQKGSRAEPMFCPFEVINWLVKTGIKKKPRLENFMGWHILETKFSSVYAEKSIGDPR